MALAKRGSRRIIVAGVDYRWVVSADDGYMVLVVELDDSPGQRLEAIFGYSDLDEPAEEGNSRTGGQRRSLRPGVVCDVIRAALQRGWQPSRRGLPALRMHDADQLVPVNDTVGTPMSKEARFLQLLEADPLDDVTRAVYADWLEESGDVKRGEFLRLQLAVGKLPAQSQERRVAQERLGALRARLEASWLRAADPLARLGELSQRARFWAQRLGFATVGDLCDRSAEEILQRCFSETLLRELETKLAQQGLQLRDG
jgi:uncharacterized protein (TIGR02996 family)